MALKDTLIGQAINKVRNYISNAVSDNKGWIRQGQFTPGREIVDYFTPTTNAGKNFWSTPVAKGLASIQKTVQNAPIFEKPITPSYKPTFAQRFTENVSNFPRFNIPLPQLKTGLKPIDITVNTVGQLAKSLPETYLNIPRNLAVSSSRMGEVIGKSLIGQKTPVAELTSAIAPGGEALLDLATAGTKNLFKNTTKDLAKGGIKIATKAAIKEYGTVGGLSAILRSLGNQKEDIDVTKTLGEGALGAIGGSIFGAAIGAGAGTKNSITDLVTGKIKRLQPELSVQQAKDTATRYLRNEVGQFMGKNPNYRNKKDIIFYGDLRESLGLPRGGPPQIGQSTRLLTKLEHEMNQPQVGGVEDLTWAKGTRAAGIQNAGIKNYNQATKALEKAGELPTVIKTDKTTKDFIKNYYETKKIPVVGDIFENAKGEKVEITKIGDNSVDYFLKGKKKGIYGTVYLENPISQPIKTGEVSAETLKKEYDAAKKEFVMLTGEEPRNIRDLTEFKVNKKIPYGYSPNPKTWWGSETNQKTGEVGGVGKINYKQEALNKVNSNLEIKQKMDKIFPDWKENNPYRQVDDYIEEQQNLFQKAKDEAGSLFSKYLPEMDKQQKGFPLVAKKEDITKMRELMLLQDNYLNKSKEALQIKRFLDTPQPIKTGGVLTFREQAKQYNLPKKELDILDAVEKEHSLGTPTKQEVMSALRENRKLPNSYIDAAERLGLKDEYENIINKIKSIDSGKNLTQAIPETYGTQSQPIKTGGVEDIRGLVGKSSRDIGMSKTQLKSEKEASKYFGKQAFGDLPIETKNKLNAGLDTYFRNHPELGISVNGPDVTPKGFGPEIPKTIYKEPLQKLTNETGLQAIARKVGYQIDNGRVILEQDKAGWKSTIMGLGDNEKSIIRGNTKDDVIFESFKKLYPQTDLSQISPESKGITQMENVPQTAKIKTTLSKTKGLIPTTKVSQLSASDQNQVPQLSISKKGKLNTDKLNITPEQKVAIDQLQENVPVTVIGNKDVIQKSKLTTGRKTAMTDDEMKLRLAQQLNTRQEVVSLQRQFDKLKASGASETELLALKGKIAEQSRIAQQQGTFAGRLLQAQNILANEYATPEQRIYALLDNAGIDQKKYLKDAINVDFNDATQVVNFYRKFVPPKFGDILTEIRYSNMLSSPLTQIVNTTSNILQSGFVKPIEKTITGGLDFISSKLTGKERKYFASQGIDYAKGYWSSLPEAWKKFKNIASGKELQLRPDLENIPTTTKGFMKAYTTPLRLLEASDQFFRTLVTGGEKRSLARFKLSEAELAKRASQSADYTLFRQKFDPDGKLGQGKVLQLWDKWNTGVQMLRRLPGGNWIVPFLQTPTNILKQGFEYSPLGVSTMVGAKEPLVQLSKAMIGTAAFMSLYGIADKGGTTWDAPTGAKEKELFYSSGLQPYSVKIGDKWVSYSKLGPLAYPLAMASALKWVEKNNPDQNVAENLRDALGQMVGFFGDQSYVQSIGDVIGAIQGGSVNKVQSAISAEASNIVRQMIPYTSFQGWLTRMIDPVYRKPQGIVEDVKAQIPGLSTQVEPYTNIQGGPSQRDLPLVNAVSPFRIGVEKPEVKSMLETQESARIKSSQMKKEKEKFGETGGMTKDNIYYPTADGVKTLDLSKLDDIAKLPSDNKYNSAIKESKQYSEAAKILDNTDLTTEQQQTALNRLGINKTEADYYRVANDNTNLKTMFVLDKVQNKSHDEVLQSLIEQRKQVNGQMIASNAVLDNLVDEGIITKNEATQLKKYKYENGKLTPMKISSGKTSGKKIKVTLRKVGKIKFKKAKVRKLKTKKFAQIKLPKYQGLKVKKFT